MTDKLTLSLNDFEAGCLLGLIEQSSLPALGEVKRQLLAMKQSAEMAAGVKREMLADGRIKFSDAAGNIIIREPYSWEVNSERSL